MTTLTSLTPSLRLRTVALAALFGFTTFFVSSAPTEAPLPRPDALVPQPAKALACADGPSFVGRLTNTASTTTGATYSTTGNVYGYISDVVDDWSCTAWYRYDGLAWARNDAELDGNFDWGNLINSTTVACNWGIGSTDYLKANSTTDCPDTDAEYALPIFLSNYTTTMLETVWHADSTPDEPGDFGFIHSDCETYYFSESLKENATWTTTSTANRPGANCDPYDLESTDTTQAIVVDGTAPSTNFDWPPAGGPTLVPSAFAGVQFDATDTVAGFSGSANDWDLQRQKATWSGSACGAFANDTTTGNLTSGTTSAADQVVRQSLADATCYRWTLAAKDANGNTAATITSGSIRTDLSSNLGQQGHHAFETWDLGAGDTLAVNVGTGNLVITHPIVSLPIQGGSFDLSLTYNRHDTTNVGIGPGWRLDAFRRLAVETDGDVTFTDGDGARHRFDYSAGTYTRPATLYATLTRDTAAIPDRFTLTFRDGSFEQYDELITNTAYLVREEDRHGSAVTYTYDASRQLTRIEDPDSRDIDLIWTSGKVTSIRDWAVVTGGVVQTSGTPNRTHRFFYDVSGSLKGWADPLAPTGDCTAGGSHITCLTLASTQIDIAKTQTYATLDTAPNPDVIASASRVVTTRVSFANADVTTVKDAQEVANATAGTAFTHTAPGQTQVVRRGTAGASLDTTTRSSLVSPTDAYARVATVARKLGTSWITTTTAYSATYPIEVASVTEDDGGSLERTVTNTWSGGTIGPNLTRVVEPLTATTSRWTDRVYNANHDVTETRVSLDGSTTERTITRSCYGTACNTGDAGDDLLRVIDNYVDKTAGGTNGHVEDVTVEYQYDSYGQRTRETRQNYAPGGTLLDSRAIGFEYDTYGNLTKEIANYVSGTVTNPGDDITPNATTNARTDLTTVHTYDTAGNRVSTADPRRAIEAAKGTTLGADDFITRQTYDALGQQLTDKTPTTPGITVSQRTAATVYDELGAVRSATDFGGQVSASGYDRSGRTTATFEDADGSGTTHAARQTSATTVDPSGREISALDERQLATSGLGSTTTAYDELGRATTVTEADGAADQSDESETRTGYDRLDRRTTFEPGWQSDGSHQTTVYRYDTGGRITETDDEFACTRETFDYRDFAVGTRPGLASGGTACTGTGTRRLTHTFDGLGRLLQTQVTEAYEDPAELNDKTAIATFDAAGNQRTSGTYDASAGTTTTDTTTNNPIDQAIVEVRADGSVAKTNHDAAGNPTDRCFWTSATSETCHAVGYAYGDPPDTASTTGYDARNNRVSLASPTAGETTYDPDADYRVKATYLPTATGKEQQTLFDYWPTRHTLKKVTHQLCAVSGGSHTCGSPVAMGSAEYTLDGNDNRTKVIEDPTGTTSTTNFYCYDPLDRLTTVSSSSATCASGITEVNAFDDAGNRTATTGRTFTYSSTGQLTGCNPSCGTIVHDAAGRMVHYNGWYLWYDPESRLSKACTTATCTTSGNKVTFAYDGEGHRTKITSTIGAGATTTIALRYQGDAVAAETNAAGTVTRTYATDETGTIVKFCDPDCTGTNPQYLVTWNGHGDAQSLWRIETSGALTLANSYTYLTWGTPAETLTYNGIADLKFRFLYVGRYGVQWDDLGTGLAMHYMQARHYFPAIGRFLQPDPAALEANHYAYAGNSPVTKVDPSGEYATPNWLEKWMCRKYASKCRVWQSAGFWAHHYTDNVSTKKGKRNALRHCVWQCILAYASGNDWAARWAFAHEFGAPRRDALDTTVDLHNNHVGRLLGTAMRGKLFLFPADFAWQVCEAAWRRGWLWYHGSKHIYWSDGRRVR